ncbi:hypothetical protein [Corynebacterium glyciniphilum]|uniref:hypothetical protein n=1 Tax=Corynebacterium glyciniphilum TaxID=1404244 RepID=UPI002656A4A7|nr:hypothetical protein [Corynebacterium glyciniphilum]MDN6704596.1 transposase [Corynebacterium glyciniphilum]
MDVVTMGGFAGYATAVEHALPTARKVMDKVPIRAPGEPRSSPGVGNACSMKLPGDGKVDALHKSRRTLLARIGFSTERQKQRLKVQWAVDDDHITLEAAWSSTRTSSPRYRIRAGLRGRC